MTVKSNDQTEADLANYEAAQAEVAAMADRKGRLAFKVARSALNGRVIQGMVGLGALERSDPQGDPLGGEVWPAGDLDWDRILEAATAMACLDGWDCGMLMEALWP